MKNFLVITALFEGAAGFGLAAFPGMTFDLLMGSPLEDAGGMLLGRLAGIALLSLAVICWLNRNQGPNASGTCKGLLFYHVAAAALLIYTGLAESFPGAGMWFAAIAHFVLALWCTMLLLKKQAL